MIAINLIMITINLIMITINLTMMLMFAKAHPGNCCNPGWQGARLRCSKVTFTILPSSFSSSSASSSS